MHQTITRGRFFCSRYGFCSRYENLQPLAAETKVNLQPVAAEMKVVSAATMGDLFLFLQPLYFRLEYSLG